MKYLFTAILVLTVSIGWSIDFSALEQGSQQHLDQIKNVEGNVCSEEWDMPYDSKDTVVTSVLTTHFVISGNKYRWERLGIRSVNGTPQDVFAPRFPGIKQHDERFIFDGNHCIYFNSISPEYVHITNEMYEPEKLQILSSQYGFTATSLTVNRLQITDARITGTEIIGNETCLVIQSRNDKHHDILNWMWVDPNHNYCLVQLKVTMDFATTRPFMEVYETWHDVNGVWFPEKIQKTWYNTPRIGNRIPHTDVTITFNNCTVNGTIPDSKFKVETLVPNGTHATDMTGKEWIVKAE